VVALEEVHVLTIREAPFNHSAKTGETLADIEDQDLVRHKNARLEFTRMQRHLAVDMNRIDLIPKDASQMFLRGPDRSDAFARENGKNTFVGSGAAALHAIGTDATEAIRNFCSAKGWTLEEIGEPLEGGDPRFEWGFRFTADGTHFKASGWAVPGGVALTWWS
jgi:hypothetical protein